MARSRKITIGLAIAGSLGLAFLGFFIYLSIQISDIKGPLIETLEERIDGELKIGSAVAVLFPAGIDLKDVSLYAPGETQPSATIKKAKLRLSLIPLVQKKIETSLTLLEPEVYLRQPRKGPSNMARIFAPLLKEEAPPGSNSGSPSQAAPSLEKFWWKRVAVNKLSIQDAYFKSTREGSDEVMELKNLSLEADRIRFDTKRGPADIQLSYDLPSISDVPMKLRTRLQFKEEEQALEFQEGKFTWGPAEINLGGRALLPSSTRKDVDLDLKFNSQRLSLKKFAKILKEPLPLSGDLTMHGTVTGTALAPVLNLVLDSPQLQAKNHTLNQFHAEIAKQEKPIEIKTASFNIFGGSVMLNGTALREKSTSANLNIILKSLSLAAISGKPGNPSRLHGTLKLKTPRVEVANAYSGGGTITVGPIPLPPVNLRNKVAVAEILSAATGLNTMVNVGILSNSANVIGTRIDQVRAQVSIANGNISLKPFSMGNGHFNASGNANIFQQKSINGGGTFTLKPHITRQILIDPLLRQTLTQGSGQLSVPFTMSGPLADPNLTVDNNYLKSQTAKAMVVVLQRQALGGLQPQRLLDSVLKTTTPSDSKNRKTQPAKDKPLLDQLLFGR